MRGNGRGWRVLLVVVLGSLGVLVLVVVMYLAARFVAWALGVLILYAIVKGVTRIFRWKGKG